MRVLLDSFDNGSTFETISHPNDALTVVMMKKSKIKLKGSKEVIEAIGTCY